jgi:hypothetical protein
MSAVRAVGRCFRVGQDKKNVYKWELDKGDESLTGRARTDVPSSPSPGRARPAVDRSARCTCAVRP